ncbi:MAG TPA: hypothetical protein VIM56_06250 [Rhizomicrobium sp.]
MCMSGIACLCTLDTPPSYLTFSEALDLFAARYSAVGPAATDGKTILGCKWQNAEGTGGQRRLFRPNELGLFRADPIRLWLGLEGCAA